MRGGQHICWEHIRAAARLDTGAALTQLTAAALDLDSYSKMSVPLAEAVFAGPVHSLLNEHADLQHGRATAWYVAAGFWFGEACKTDLGSAAGANVVERLQETALQLLAWQREVEARAAAAAAAAAAPFEAQARAPAIARAQAAKKKADERFVELAAELPSGDTMDQAQVGYGRRVRGCAWLRRLRRVEHISYSKAARCTQHLEILHATLRTPSTAPTPTWRPRGLSA